MVFSNRWNYFLRPSFCTICSLFIISLLWISSFFFLGEHVESHSKWAECNWSEQTSDKPFFLFFPHWISLWDFRCGMSVQKDYPWWVSLSLSNSKRGAVLFYSTDLKEMTKELGQRLIVGLWWEIPFRSPFLYSFIHRVLANKHIVM